MTDKEAAEYVLKLAAQHAIRKENLPQKKVSGISSAVLTDLLVLGHLVQCRNKQNEKEYMLTPQGAQKIGGTEFTAYVERALRIGWLEVSMKDLETRLHSLSQERQKLQKELDLLSQQDFIEKFSTPEESK